MQWIQRLLPQIHQVNQPRQFHNLSAEGAGASPQLADLLNRTITGQATMSPFMDRVVKPVTERANLEVSQRGRTGSGAHAGWIAKNLGPLYHQEHGRVANENLARTGLGLQAGGMQHELSQRVRDEQKERHWFGQNEPRRSLAGEIDQYSGLARLGRKDYQDTDIEKSFFDKMSPWLQLLFGGGGGGGGGGGLWNILGSLFNSGGGGGGGGSGGFGGPGGGGGGPSGGGFGWPGWPGGGDGGWGGDWGGYDPWNPWNFTGR